MIKDLKEYRQYRARTHDKDITPEERNEIRKAMRVFKDNNPTIFEELLRKKWELPI